MMSGFRKMIMHWVFVSCLIFDGLALAASQNVGRTTPADGWTWQNPFEGVEYYMSQFQDKTVIAVRQSKILPNGMIKIYTVQPGAAPGQTSGREMPPPDGGVVHNLWKQRKISCTVQREETDLFGNKFNVCQARPFDYKAIAVPRLGQGSPRVLGDAISQKGQVWIMTPTAGRSTTLNLPLQSTRPKKAPIR